MTKHLSLSFLLAFVCAVVWAQKPFVIANKRTTTITINGNPSESEWQFTNSVAKTLVGSPNNGVTYAVLWDDLYLYIAARVSDINKRNDSPNGWDDDAIEVFIDAENNGGTSYGINDRQFVKEWNSSTLWEKNGNTANVVHAWATITGGYGVEMRIPWSSIGITNPTAGFAIGFDIFNDDDDNGKLRDHQLAWAGDSNNWQYPGSFGTLYLSSNDTEAPSIPTNLSAATLTQSSLTLNWTAATDNIGVAGYDVFQNGIKINATLVPGNSYAVTGLNAVTNYQYYVIARDAAGNQSGNSNTINITTPDTEAPSVPGNLSVSNLTTGSLNINWTPSGDNVGVTGYDVFQDGLKINAAPVSSNTYPVSGLSAATLYQFYVTAFDAAGNTSNSSTISITTPAPADTEAPTAPSNLVVSNITQTGATLNWTAATDNIAVTAYDIYRDNIKIASTVTTTYQATGLAALVNYDFYIVARDAAGNASTSSNTAGFVTPDSEAPTAPSNLSASSITQTSFTLNWTASTDNIGVAGYDIYQDNIKINSTPVTSTSYPVSGLNNNTTYSYYINASDAAGNSTNSASFNVTTLAPPDLEVPSAITDLSYSGITQSNVTINWTAATDNVGVSGYEIYQNNVLLTTASGTATSYTVNGLTALVTYQFYLVARDAAGNASLQSNTVTVITPDTEAPTAPANLSSPGVTATALTIQWSAATDNIAVTGYDIYQDNIKINPAPVTVTSYAISGLTEATAYNIYVKAFDNAGNPSVNSSTILVTTADISAPTAPANLGATAITNSSLTLNWLASTDNVLVAGYDVYRNGIKINGAMVTATSYGVSGLSAATTYSFHVQARDAAGNISANSNVLNVTTAAVSIPPCSNTGTIAYQKWNNITGATVASLTSNTAYPNSPSVTGTLTSFETAAGSGDNYGIRVNGYICPPTTGSYRFWISGDDNVELWLSTTSNVANKVRIAYHTSYTNSREWNKFTTQKSVAISLTAGQPYYVEAIMKQGTGGDHMAVGWSKPGQGTRSPSEVIPGNRLLAQLVDLVAPSEPTNLTASAIAQSSLTLNWTASTDNVAVTGYDVYQDNIKINTANITATTYNVTGLTPSTQYNYFIIAKDNTGNNSNPGNTITITTGAPDTEAPSMPVNLAANNMGQTFFTLNWQAATDNVGVAGYDIFRNGTRINTAVVTGNSYVVTGLTPGTTYAMNVIALDAAGNTSSASATLDATTLFPTPGSETFTQRTIIGNQRMPHDLVYGPDNNIWYTERFAGTVSFVNPSTSVKRVVLSLGATMVRAGGQDGLMGLALHPQFITGKPYVYIAYTYQSTSSTVRKTRIERYTYNNSTQTLGSPVTILQDIPGSNDHNSARLAIGPDLKLYFTVGDMGAGQFDNTSRANNAQNLLSLEGKVLRLNTEVENSTWIPADNPFTNGGVKTAVYTLGHRNPQGLVWGNVNGASILYSSEHGPYSDDELNTIEAGRNYGWPQVAGFCDGNYNGRTVGGFSIVNEQANCVSLNVKEPIRSLFPVATPPTDATNNMTWPSTAPSGTDFYGSNAIPGWQNSLLVAQLKAGTITRFKLSNDGLSIISDTIHYFRGKGRFRDVIVSPDGLKIYVACDSSGSTSGPTGGVTSTPANPGSILEFTYQPPVGARAANQQMVNGLLPDELKDKTMDVYPNPADDFIIVYSYDSKTAKNIELYDVAGKLVSRQVATNLANRVKTGQLAGGIYILKVRDANGKITRIEKILIRH